MTFDNILNYSRQIIIDFWGTLAEMSPYLLFGFFVAGLLTILVSREMVERHLGGKGIWPIFKASLAGVPMPLCSCSVIPVSMSLRKHGASKGATISFLLSTPQTGADNIFVIFSLLGPIFAIFSPIVAFTTGIIGGVAVSLFDRSKDAEYPEKCTDGCCSKNDKKPAFVKVLKYGFVSLPRDIGKEMLIGVLIAAFITSLVPEGFFAEKLGTGLFPMFVMLLVGIPMYVCSIASIPIAAALIMKGMTPGAALVFLMTGPATNAASFIVIWKILGGKTAIIYLVSIAVCAILFGLLLDQIVTGLNIKVADSCHGFMLPSLLKNISAVVLMAVLLFATFRKSHKENVQI